MQIKTQLAAAILSSSFGGQVPLRITQPELFQLWEALEVGMPLTANTLGRAMKAIGFCGSTEKGVMTYYKIESKK